MWVLSILNPDKANAARLGGAHLASAGWGAALGASGLRG